MLTARRSSTKPTSHVAAPTSTTTAPAEVPEPDRLLGFDVAALALFDYLNVNVMIAGPDLVIRYVNRQSMATLRGIRHLLPVEPEQVVGSSVDIFHRNPAHQRRVLGGDSAGFPHRATIQLGDQYLDLNVAMAGTQEHLLGFVVAWSVVTDRETVRFDMQELAGTVSASVTEFEASISEISRSASESASIARAASDAAANATAKMAELNQRTDAIGAIVSFIAGVASQTNLLALNATIESARAGEAGKGFAVVAHEVKQLAGATSQSTGDIRAAVEGIVGAVNDARASMAAVDAIISGLGELSSSIAAAVEEQAAAMGEFSRFAAVTAERAQQI
jgi:methyl-accepting chemotaxis protein